MTAAPLVSRLARLSALAAVLAVGCSRPPTEREKREARREEVSHDPSRPTERAKRPSAKSAAARREEVPHDPCGREARREEVSHDDRARKARSAARGSVARSVRRPSRPTEPKPVTVAPEAPLRGRVYDLRGAPSTWGRGLPGRLVFPDVHPGITLVWETRRHGMAYRFDVAPRADARAIRVRYQGAAVSVDEGGRALRVRMGDLALVERGLTCFQEAPDGRRDVACRYEKTDRDEVAVALGPYDRDRPLVIDPEIDWSSYLGGTNADHGRGVAIDPSGNVYVTGYTFSSDFPASGGFDPSLGGGSDAFISKVDPSGSSLIWSSYLGGSEHEHAHAIAVDAGGNAYVTGYTLSADFPKAGGFDATNGGVEDAFVAKLDTNGSLLWSSYLGGSGPDQGNGIAVDAGGAVIVVGHTLSPNFPASGGFDVVLDGGDDGFVTRVLATGSGLDWSSFLGGDSDDTATAVALDTSGNALITGTTLSADFPSAGGFDPMGGGGVEDAFVTKVDTAGPSLVWSSYLGGSASDRGLGIAVDAAGDVYVTGHTVSASFPIVGGFDSALDGALDAFVTKVNALGSSLAWSSFLGGEGDDYGYAIAIDALGAAHVAGRTTSIDFVTTGGFDTALGGPVDAFVAKVDPAGAAVEWSSYVGGAGSDYSYAIAVRSDGNVALAGETFSTDFPSTRGFDATHGGSADAFVTRVVVCGSGTCEPGEDACSCPADCGADLCDNGCCGPLETECTCAADCGAVCGDACCLSETQCTCEADCGADSCGNGCCGPLENECTCAADCGAVCGDTCCTAGGDGGTGGETQCTCEADCGPDTCGNGCCGPLEDACNCEADCGADACGNGCCGPAETACDCEVDCGPDRCDNGCCGAAENADLCSDDCPDICGDTFCHGDETCTNCPNDCGDCPEDPVRKDPPACGCRVGGEQRPALLWHVLALALVAGVPRLRRRAGLRTRATITCAFWTTIHPDWRRCSSVAYLRVRALLAPCHPGASSPRDAHLIIARVPTALAVARGRRRRALSPACRWRARGAAKPTTC